MVLMICTKWAKELKFQNRHENRKWLTNNLCNKFNIHPFKAVSMKKKLRQWVFKKNHKLSKVSKKKKKKINHK